ncbi:hypothetical protein [Endozoicomonas sp. 2B-B]
MTNARPNALSLAVVVAISSSIIATQALADRRLQTKSFDILGNKPVEFTWGEVMVQATLGDDQQPIPKSFTTTYPDRTHVKADYDVPSEGFTDILSGIEGGVSNVDLFETDDNDTARKYTKILKVGNEAIFRFTHNLAEKKLVIEVRDGMTDQDSIEAIRNQSGDIQPLDPLTKIASPEQLAGLLKGANERAGNLGKVDHYVALATVAVDEVEVNGRTFMRLVAAGDEPPELQRLGQSLFINDEALLAAATSAYTQVHVLKDDLQQEALNHLLSYHKPVGYVVHIEDETKAYYVPDGYPRLDVIQAPGEEIIVFHGQKQNPTDIAFVKGLFNLGEEVVSNDPAPAVTAQVKKDKLKSYQYIIRSRQMALLEEVATDFAVQFDAEFEEGKLLALARYEVLQQALTSATPNNDDEFEFTATHIRVASSIMTPTWMQVQLETHFNFKPVLRDLLASEAFVQSVQRVIPLVAKLPADAFEDSVKLATKVLNVLKEKGTPGHRAWPEVLWKLGAVEEAIELAGLYKEQDVHFRRQAISDEMQSHIEEIAKWAEEDALQILKAMEIILNLKVKVRAKVNKDDYKAARISNVRLKLDDDDIPEDILDQMLIALWEEDSTLLDERAIKLERLRARLSYSVEDSKERARDQQRHWLEAVEEKLNIKTSEPDVTERIAAIDDELDELMARLGPKPRYVVDRELAVARREMKEAGDELISAYRKLGRLKGKNVKFAGNRADIQHLSDEDNKALNRDMKKVQIHLGLAADDDQTSEGRIKDIRLLLQKNSAEKRDEMLENLRAKTNLNIEITSGLSLLEDSDYFIAISFCADSHDQEEVLGRLPLTRKRYTRIAEFLREHDRRSMELANARLEERNAKEKLDRKEKEIMDPVAMDQNAKTVHEDEMVRLGSVLKQKSDAVSKAKVALTDYHKAVLDATEASARLKPDASDTIKQRINALRNKQLQMGGDDGTGGWIGQLFDEQAHLEDEIETWEACIETRFKALSAARYAVENDDSPFQYSPKQAEVLDAIYKFTQQHTLKKQALEATLGLAELATESGKFIQDTNYFDFDDEFAPVRLRALIGDGLGFDQASRIVEVFRNLKTTFPDPPFGPLEHRPLNALQTIEWLKCMARNELETGAQQYDEEIHRMAAAAIHQVEHEPGNLKSFSDYFASHSASAKKIITLLREGLISKIELEHYMKSFRGVGDYQTVDEFEHFLGYKHGVRLPEFRKVVQMLSDEGIKELMQSAFNPVTLTTTCPAGMKESVAGMKEYSAAVIANSVLDDIAFDNGRRTAAFLTNIQDTLTPYANAAGLSESELIKAIHGTLMQAHAAAVEQQLNDYWGKPSAFLVQAVTWYFSSYKPLLVTHTTLQAAEQSLLNMSFLYLLDLTNRGDYLHRMLIPFQHWLEGFGVDPDRTGQYAYHSGIEKVSEVGGLAMPLGKAASSVILLRTGAMLFARQHNANPQMYRSISRLLPELVKSMGSGQGVQVPLLHRATPQKLKTLTSATASLMLGPVATAGAYAYGLISGFTYAQTFGFALASSLAFDFFMNDNKMLTQWLGGPLGRSLDKINRWTGVGETTDNYVKRTTIARPQRFDETDAAYASHVKANNTLYGWTRHENYLQFRERRDRTMKLFENGWEKYFRENLPGWSFSHAESIPYFYTLGAFYRWQKGDDQKVHGHDKSNAPQSGSLSATMTH